MTKIDFQPVFGRSELDMRYVPHPKGGITSESRVRRYDGDGNLASIGEWSGSGARLFAPESPPSLWMRVMNWLRE